MPTPTPYHRPTPYPFGSSLKTRGFSAGSGFRFGFNTQEKDKEVYNNNETYTATFWEYDARLGRRWNVDPKSDIYATCFAVLKNNPILYNDEFGDIPWPVLRNFANSLGKIISRRIDIQFKSPNRPNHNGLDINLGGGGDDLGVPVHATHTGIVMINQDKSDKNAAGNRIHIVSADGSLKTVYMHLKESSNLKVGEIVHKGDVIGEIGGSGFGKDDGQQIHLHYEIHKKNEKGILVPINPLNIDGSLKDPQKC